MEERKRQPSARHLPALILAGLAVTVMSFSVSRLSRAAGEPTVIISLGDTALTVGETSSVTFFFSSTPFGFTDADVDLTDTHGTLSPVAVTSDDRVYTATFTPDAGVNDPTNTIVVGTQWVDSGGVSPVADSTSANFSIQTVASGGSGSCPPSSVTLGSPNGGETLVAGNGVDVFWNMNGCQATSLQLLLSSDGGATYAVTATSPQPTSGYYRWTVPDAPSAASRLQAKLLGSGGTVLATDVSDGTFVIQSAPASTVSGTAPPPATSTPPTASPPAPTPPPTPSPDPTTPSATGTPPPPATTPPTSSPPAPKPTPRQAVAPPMPNIPVPLTQTTPPPDTPTQPTDAPMDDVNQNPTTAAPTAITLDGAQSALETASGFAPSSLELAFSFALGALAMLGLMLGVQQTIKRNKAKSPHRCRRCQGSGEEPKEKKAAETCDECDGTGQVEDENEPSMECKHCDGEGEDPCHVCKGRGKDAAGRECPACKGGGKTLTGKQDEDGEDEIADCEICRGEGEIEATVKKMIPCDKCGGTGKI